MTAVYDSHSDSDQAEPMAQHLSSERMAILNLPIDWVDLRDPVQSFAKERLEEVFKTRGSRQIAISVRRVSTYKHPTRQGAKDTSVLQVHMHDRQGNQVTGWCLSSTKEAMAIMNANRYSELDKFYVTGKLCHRGGGPHLENMRLVPPEFLGKLIPLYAGLDFASPEHTAAYAQLLHTIEADAHYVAHEVVSKFFANNADVIGKTFGFEPAQLEENLAWALHAAHHPDPDHPEQLQQALDLVGKVNAVALFARARITHTNIARSRTATPIRPTLTLSDLQSRFGHELTKCQRTAIREILLDLGKQTSMHRLLSGDTGTGKTAVFGLVAIAVAHAGYPVAILAPTETLVGQIHERIASWAPDVRVDKCIGGSMPGRAISVGTTALMNDQSYRPALVIVDEQQSFSRDQREALFRGNSGLNPHLLEATATPIPRSTALSELNILETSFLHQPHQPKEIKTAIWTADQKKQMFDEIRRTLDEGGQVMVFYFFKDEEDQPTADKKPSSVKKALEPWLRKFPGKVVAAYAGRNRAEVAEVEANINKFRRGQASILLTTSLLERGADFPNVRRVVVHEPTRFGLLQLHQIRGRAAREGGIAHCDLYLPNPSQVPADKIAMYQEFAATTDGHKVAKLDLKNRGPGDLAAESSRQHGAAEPLFSGGVASPEHSDWAVGLVGLLPDWNPQQLPSKLDSAHA